ncbi:hypothetical protein BDN72DRAFT_769940 [Pluteus cervinus]|uniref:Uncharacterized protein n=1 Tax=Pluteus cervinus TaxID=181527 RepID=A0ACD3AR84_9AGAR|nr:hypothetical protein BDN72DRAFT_769940 [Pluteus cervinus]
MDESSSSEAVSDPSGSEVDGGTSDASTSASASDSESDGDPSKLVHETVASPKKTKPSRKKTKYVPQDETPEQRDLRTIFVGNLTIEVAEKRSALKQLHRHILSGLPNAKIESTRFRSIAFQNPTAKLADESTTSSKPFQRSKPDVEPSTPNPHSRSRAASWRERQSGADAEDPTLLKQDEKKYLTPAQKKKVAFIHHEFHSSASTVNAYIVFAHSPPSAPTSDDESNTPRVMDPYEAARKAAELFDGSMFMERMIRVDVALRGSARAKLKSSLGDVGMGAADPKLSIFVGNLDFESREEDLRVYFEGVIAAERGPPADAMESDDENEDTENEKGTKLKKLKTWVTRVRIIRDKETQLGKGFAYVQFADRQCVDEVLAMEEGKLKFAKRKLRVQRCKTIPGVSLPSKSLSSHKAAGSTKSPNVKATDASRRKPIPIPIPGNTFIPKGDPSLGAKLAGLSKHERKEAKATDADRIARRLAKKKARIALGNAGVKVVGKESGGKTKERKRDRKSGGGDVDKKTRTKIQTSGKGRARSEKTVSKRNTKK